MWAHFSWLVLGRELGNDWDIGQELPGGPHRVPLEWSETGLGLLWHRSGGFNPWRAGCWRLARWAAPKATLHSWLLVACCPEASLLRDVTHSSLQFPMYEYLKLVCANLNNISKDSLPTWQATGCGVLLCHRHWHLHRDLV
eukprot:Skav201904  [mRNA]  locus=scaffold3992:26171:27029:+ [translate_table: standard]